MNAPSSATLPPRVALHDLGIVIACRFDSRERRENLEAMLRCLGRMYDGLDVHVIEDAPAPEGKALGDLPGVTWHARPNDGKFHRTRLLNEGFFQLTDRPYVATWDTDVIPHPGGVAAALTALAEGKGMVLPFDGRFNDLRGRSRQALVAMDDPTPEVMDWYRVAMGGGTRPRARDLKLVNSNSVGGVVFYDRAALRAFGGYNEDFVTWGFEDEEIAARAALFGYPRFRVDRFPVVHLWHPRITRNIWFYLRPNRNRDLREEIGKLDRAAVEALRDKGTFGRIA